MWKDRTKNKMIVKTKQLLSIASLLLCLIGASSFSPTKIMSPVSSVSLNAYHFGAGAVRKEPPVAKRSYKGYVPDGLTLEEYTKIKEEELKKQRSMNFGMWGPRFVSYKALECLFHCNVACIALPNSLLVLLFCLFTETNRW